MLDKLLKMADEPLKQVLAGVDPAKASQATNVIEESVLNSLKNQVDSGDLSAIKEMFSGKDTDPSSPVLNNLKGDVSHSLMDKLGIDSNTAMTMAAAAIPIVMNMFNKKVNAAPQAKGDILSSVVDSIKGVGGSKVSDILDSFLGRGKEGKGGMDLGGLIDMGKGLFNK